MKNSPIFLVLLLFLLSCKKSAPVAPVEEEPVFADKNFNRIRVPDGGQIQAVAGDISDTLLVTTLYNTYLITNNGKTFTLTTKHLNNTSGLFVSKDTIYALSGSAYDAKFEKQYASLPSYYTVDKGLTWKPAYDRVGLYMMTGIVTTKNNDTIQLNYHTGPDKNGRGNSYVLKTTISKTSNGFTRSFDHPIKDEQPSNLYIDKEGRLYITTGGYFNAAGVYISSSIKSPAYLYISKLPV